MKNESKIKIFKIGGNIIANHEMLASFITEFVKIEGPKLIIHGGGKTATSIGKKLNIPAKMIDGRRVTNAETLQVITMVYGGLLNKDLVAKLQGKGENAIGLSGVDGNLITAQRRIVNTTDYGYVGDIETVNVKWIKTLIDENMIPVICAITHDSQGQLLNTNADTMASEIAIAMKALYEVELFYCFDKKGVLREVDNPDSIIPYIDTESYKMLCDSGVITAGMLPKLENCFHALRRAVHKVYIGNISMLNKKESGTQIEL